MQVPGEICCLKHRRPLSGVEGALVCAEGCRYPVVAGIPRFVETSGYASGFGRQWNAWRRTQLDSVSGLTITRDRLTRCAGGSLDVVSGKSLLEAGCGAGRFTEVLLGAGARVASFDLSSAVDACHANIGDRPDHFCFQADIQDAPVKDGSFDVVFCLGVIQHTPSPERTINALARCVRPGGLLIVDHYAPHDTKSELSHRTPMRSLVRGIAIRLPSSLAYWFVRTLCRVLIPMHRFVRPPDRFRGQGRLRRLLRRWSPVMDYYETLPELAVSDVEIWMTLDTHDALTDRYKHHRTVEEIRDALTAAGLAVEAAYYGGNGVEARARKPA